MAKSQGATSEKDTGRPNLQALRAECESLAGALDAIEGYTVPHATRMATYAERIARKFGMTDEACLELRLAALLHDIGEQALHLTFLRQDRTLNFTERLELWRHPIVGEQQAARRNMPVPVQLLVRWHHENWDGSGYPDGLRGEAIPLPARILRVVDVFCTLTSLRPFRRAYTVPEALEHLRRMVGLELDPKVVFSFLEIEAERAKAEEKAEAVSENQIPESEGEELIQPSVVGQAASKMVLQEVPFVEETQASLPESPPTTETRKLVSDASYQEIAQREMVKTSVNESLFPEPVTTLLPAHEHVQTEPLTGGTQPLSQDTQNLALPTQNLSPQTQHLTQGTQSLSAPTQNLALGTQLLLSTTEEKEGEAQ